MATIPLSTQQFKDKVFNYEVENDWTYYSNLPAIVDFYDGTTNSGKAVEPVLEELAKEYDGKLIIYRVNTHEETELAKVFEIKNHPTFLFIPVAADPMMQPGTFPKNTFKFIIEERLLQNKS